MSNLQDTECKLMLAIKKFVYAIVYIEGVVDNSVELSDVTANLSLSNLDYWERFIDIVYAQALQECTPSRFIFWKKAYNNITLLDLVNRDGYKREKALLSLSSQIPNSFFVSIIIRRLNDWVPQVRLAARKRLPEFIRNTDPSHTVNALFALIPNWGSWARLEVEDKNVFLNIIRDEKISEALRYKLMSSSTGPMPLLFSQCGRALILDGYIERIAESAKQPAVRAKAYRSLFEKRVSWVERREWKWEDKSSCIGKYVPIISAVNISVEKSTLDLLELSAHDKSSIVRRVSAEFLIKNIDVIGEYAVHFAEKLASDNSISVSERGMFALKQLGHKKIPL